MASSICCYHYYSPPFPAQSFCPNTSRFSKSRRPTTKLSVSCSATETNELNPEAMSIDNLHRFFGLNIGKWHGSFHQFDANGKLMQKVSTKLSASTYGEEELMSLIQTLYIRQPPTDGYGEEEWAEYKIKETNMFTVDKYQMCADRILPR